MAKEILQMDLPEAARPQKKKKESLDCLLANLLEQRYGSLYDYLYESTCWNVSIMNISPGKIHNPYTRQ